MMNGRNGRLSWKLINSSEVMTVNLCSRTVTGKADERIADCGLRIPKFPRVLADLFNPQSAIPLSVTPLPAA
jgi:hypothetical protein